MPMRLLLTRCVAAILLCGPALPAAGQAPADPAPPQIGQVSKDSVWVPTPERMIRRMMQLADVTPQDLVIDLGSGDGRMPIHAARHFGARAIGVELEENLVALSVRTAQAQGVSHLVRFLRQDLFQADLSQATVIALYISPGVMSKLKPQLLALKPGTRIVSHHFTLEDWTPDETVRTENRTAYLWVVPPTLRGSWSVSIPGQSLRLQIQQKHQELAIHGERAGRAVTVIGAQLRGTEISFTAFDADGAARRYRGLVDGGRMQGDSDGLDIAPLRWNATRD
jgi:SAM-dependent methyltransferase